MATFDEKVTMLKKKIYHWGLTFPCMVANGQFFFFTVGVIWPYCLPNMPTLRPNNEITNVAMLKPNGKKKKLNIRPQCGYLR